MKQCPSTLKCPEIDALGEYPFPDEVAFNIAVNHYCEKCKAYKVVPDSQFRKEVSDV